MNLDAVGIVSKDIKQSIQFYQLLGVTFKEVSGDHWEGDTEKGVRIMLDSIDLIRRLNPNYKEGLKGSGVVLCFKQPSPEKVDELYNRITERGFKGLKSPWDAFWGQRYSNVLDPDGNQVDIFADF